MKRKKGKHWIGFVLLSAYWVRDMLLLGWEVSNIFSFIVILLCIYAIFIWYRA